MIEKIISSIDWTFFITATVLGVVFFLIFKSGINIALNKLKGWGKNGPEFGNTQQTDNSPGTAVEELTRALESRPVFLDQELLIEKDINAKRLSDLEARRILVRYLAATQISYEFEKIYRIIYGSQINALEHLNGYPNGNKKESISPYFLQYRRSAIPHVLQS